MKIERLNEIWKTLGFTGECPYSSIEDLRKDEFNVLSPSDKLKFKCVLDIAGEIAPKEEKSNAD